MARSKQSRKGKQSKREVQVVNFVRETRRYSQMKTEPDRARWETAQNLFAGKQDWGKVRDENPWMNRVFIPLFSSVVRTGAALLHGMIFNQENFISLESAGPNEEFTRIVEKILRYEVGLTKFESRFYEAMVIGSIYGVLPQRVCTKPRLALKPEIVIDKLERQERKEFEKIASKVDTSAIPVANDEETMRIAIEEVLGKLTNGRPTINNLRLGNKKLFEAGQEYSIINPFNCFWEPNVNDLNDSLFNIEQQFLKFYQLESMFESGVLDKRKRDMVLSQQSAEGSMADAGITHSSTREGQDFAQKDQLEDSSNYFPDCELWDYYGPLISDEGKIIEENKHFTIVNQVLCKDRDNPSFLQTSPHFTATFSKIPFKGVGAGVADPGIDQNLLMNEIFSLYMDMLQMAVLNPRVYDSSKIADPSQIENGIEPAALIEGLGDASKIFSELPSGAGVGSSVLQALQFMQLTAEQGSAIDTQDANPSSRARITAEEIRSNLSRQSQTQTTMGSIVDNEVIKPFAFRMLAGVLQHSFESENLERLAEREVISGAELELLTGIDKIDRYNELTRNYTIKINGFKELLEKNDRAQRVTELVSVASQNPQMSEEMDYKEALRVIAESTGMEADKLIRQNTPYDTAREENRILADDKFIQPHEQEEHQIHLNVHYEQAMNTPNEATINHIHAHVQLATTQGIQLQTPPPEVADILGLNEEAPEEAVIQ